MTRTGFTLGLDQIFAMRQDQGRSRSHLFPIPGIVAEDLEKAMKGKPLEEVLRREEVIRNAEEAWISVCLSGLNRLARYGRAIGKLTPNAVQRSAKATVADRIRRLLAVDQKCPRGLRAVEQELSDRFLSYTGEEISEMEVLSLEQCIPALPPESHGGSIEAIGLVSNRTKVLLAAPELCVIPDVGQELPRLQAKVHIKDGEILGLAQELIKRGICDWIREEDVFRYRDQKVLNGLFGVRKSSLTSSGKPVLRVIMNLIPTNSCMMQLKGSVRDLPSITQWLSLNLGPGEEVRFSQSDMSSAFYLFRLPEKWQKYTFVLPCRAKEKK